MATINLKQAKALGIKVETAQRAKLPKAKPKLRGESCQNIWIDLPFPPALNNLYVNKRSGGRRLSERGKAYKEAVLEVVRRRVYAEHVTGRLRVEIWMYAPENRIRDIDGVFKAPLDALQAAGVFENDSQIDHLTIHRCEVEAKGRLVIHLRGDCPGD